MEPKLEFENLDHKDAADFPNIGQAKEGLEDQRHS